MGEYDDIGVHSELDVISSSQRSVEEIDPCELSLGSTLLDACVLFRL